MRATTPAKGEGISAVALSVMTSTSGSSSAISSPSFTNQRSTSASVTPSPRSGSRKSGIRERSLEVENLGGTGHDSIDRGDVVVLVDELRKGDVESGNPSHGSLEIQHYTLVNEARYLGSQPRGPRCFVNHERASTFGGRLRDRIDIERIERPQVEDASIDPSLLLQSFGCFHCQGDRRSVTDHREITAAARHTGMGQEVRGGPVGGQQRA